MASPVRQSLSSKIARLLGLVARLYVQLADPVELRDHIYYSLDQLRHKVVPNLATVEYKQLEELEKKFNLSVVCFDMKCWVLTSLEDFDKIVKIDWTERYKPWIADRRDCDDYARIFKEHLEEIWLVNSIGYALGRVYTEDGKFLGYHAFNLVPIIENSQLKWYVFEPQTDKYVELSPDNKTKLAGWIYVIDAVLF